jgi:Na+/proline symporter
MIGLAGLALFPPGSDACAVEPGAMICADREMAYPVLIHHVLSDYPGLVGFLLAGLLAAFMSTVDTHINWGASYLVNDIYLRFLRSKAGRVEQLIVSRICVIGIAMAGLIIATYTTSIEAAWKFLLAMAAGLGLPQILRWIWWRANAWTEVSGMVSSLALSLILYPAFPDAAPEHLLFAVAVGSASVSIAVTLLTPPVDADHLRRFVERVNPLGAWSEFRPGGSEGAGLRFAAHAGLWLLSSTAVLAMMFTIGYALFSNWTGALIAGIIMLATGYPARQGFRSHLLD